MHQLRVGGAGVPRGTGAGAGQGTPESPSYPYYPVWIFPISRPWGSGRAKRENEVADNHPGSRGNFFFAISGPLAPVFRFQPAPGVSLSSRGRLGPKMA